MKTSTLFYGWYHEITADDFTVPSHTCFEDWEELDEDLEPYESPTPVAVWVDKPAYFPGGQLPFHSEEMTWSGLALALKSLAKIVGGEAKAFQHNHYGEDKKMTRPTYSFQFTPGETGFKGGRL